MSVAPPELAFIDANISPEKDICRKTNNLYKYFPVLFLLNAEASKKT
jgi:hypothetical protein